MLTYPDIDPVAIRIGPLSIYWYGLSYLAGFLGAFVVSLTRGPKQLLPWHKEQVADLLFYVAMGIIFGGRIGFIILYQPHLVLQDPFTLLEFWVVGRSFHGGLIGVLLAVLLYAKIHKRSFLTITDFIAPVVPIGLGFGRIGNFINAELWGRVTTVPWGVIFPDAGPLPRHPSQLYEFGLEGIVLFMLLIWFAAKPRIIGAISGMFMLGYGVIRFAVEFVREPDSSHGFIALNWLTMGQLLSIPMIVIGLYLIFIHHKSSFVCNNI